MAEFVMGGQTIKPKLGFSSQVDPAIEYYGAMVIDKILDVTTGEPNDRPPPVVSPDPLDKGFKRPPDLLKDTAIGIVKKGTLELLFGYQPTSAGDEIPIAEREGYAPSADDLAARNGQKLPEPHVLPMWAADP